MFRVAQLVRRVRVDHQRNGIETVADHVDGLDVPTGLDLDLDAPIPRGPFHFHPLGELLERILDADGHP